MAVCIPPDLPHFHAALSWGACFSLLEQEALEYLNVCDLGIVLWGSQGGITCQEQPQLLEGILRGVAQELRMLGGPGHQRAGQQPKVSQLQLLAILHPALFIQPGLLDRFIYPQSQMSKACCCQARELGPL